MKQRFLACLICLVVFCACGDDNDDGGEINSHSEVKIAFVSNRDGDEQIFVMNADGANPTKLTDLREDEENQFSEAPTLFTSANLATYSEFNLQPTWSPDGTKIAFVSGRDGNAEIYVMNADGTNPLNITNHPASDTTPILVS